MIKIYWILLGMFFLIVRVFYFPSVRHITHLNYIHSGYEGGCFMTCVECIFATSNTDYCHYGFNVYIPWYFSG